MYHQRQRKKLRLEWYDYSSNGYYFITICTKWRENFFGEIIDGEMILNNYGEVVKNEVDNTWELRDNVDIDEYIIMPNHVHLIIVIKDNSVGNDCIVPNNIILNDIEPYNAEPINPSNMNKSSNMNDLQSGTMQSFPTLSRVVRWLKWSITSQINKIPEMREGFAWQKSFFDKIIRNDEQLNKTRQYIIDNPMKWELDINNPINIK